MSNPLNFDFQPKDKHSNYDARLLRQLLVSLGFGPMAIASDEERSGEQFGLVWFNDAYDLGIALESAKFSESVDLPFLFSANPTKSPVFKRLREAQQNWPERYVGLVFDAHGDRMADLVIHNHPLLVPEERPIIRIFSKKTPYWIVYWKDFLPELARRWSPG